MKVPLCRTWGLGSLVLDRLSQPSTSKCPSRISLRYSVRGLGINFSGPLSLLLSSWVHACSPSLSPPSSHVPGPTHILMVIHIISYHIIPYHIIPYHFISYHIYTYIILFVHLSSFTIWFYVHLLLQVWRQRVCLSPRMLRVLHSGCGSIVSCGGLYKTYVRWLVGSLWRSTIGSEWTKQEL